jgi:hypothetical protein
MMFIFIVIQYAQNETQLRVHDSREVIRDSVVVLDLKILGVMGGANKIGREPPEFVPQARC